MARTTRLGGWLLALGLLLGPCGASSHADESAGGRAGAAFDRVHLTNGRVFEGWITSETARAVVLQLVSSSGGRGCIQLPRQMVARIERGVERPAPRPPGCVRDQWYLLRSGLHVLGARRLVLRHVRNDAGAGFRIEETVEHFARGPHVPAVRTQRSELTDLAFHATQLLFREVGEASADPDGAERYERILTGPVKAGVWQALIHVGGQAEQRHVPLPPGGRGRLGAREHVLRRRATGLQQVAFVDVATGATVIARAGYTALDTRDTTGRVYDEFVWEEDDVRLVSRYRECEILEEEFAEGVVATPSTESQVDAARGLKEGVEGQPGRVQVAEIGIGFRLPDASWHFSRVEDAPSALGWRRIGGAESRTLVADLRLEWDPEGAANTPGDGEAAARLLQRMRAWCPDLRVLQPRRRLTVPGPDEQPAWRMDFTGTLRGERIRTVAVVVDQGRGRALLLVACPEVAWPQAAAGVERLVASIERL